MKKILLWVSAAAGMLALAALGADYKSSVLGDSPVAYWRFSESGFVTQPPDVATNLGSLSPADHGIYGSGVVKGMPGAVAGNTAVACAGGQSVAIPYDANLNPGVPFSVEYWIKPNTLDFTCPISATDFNVTPRLGWLFYTDPNANGYANYGYYFRVYSDAGTMAVASAAGLFTTNWTHVVGVVDGANIKIYVNGVLSGSAAWSGNLTPVTSKPLNLGVRYDGSFALNGRMDEVAIYGSALSATTIQAHYNEASTNAANFATQILADNPLGYWRLGEPMPIYPVAANSGTLGTAADGGYRYSSTTINELAGTSFPGLESTNRVLQTTGSNGLVAASALNLNTNTATMECWIKPNGVQPSYAGVLFQRGSGGSATGIDFKDTTGQLGYHWHDQGNTYGWNSGLYPADGVWTYVALAVSPSQAVMYMYDGTNWSLAANPVGHGVEAFGASIRIGADNDTGRFFQGLVDEAAVYGKTLTEGQLRTHALAAFGSTNAPVLVTDPPVLSPSGTIYATMLFTLTSDAFGAPPLSFQWQREGTNVPGATSATFARSSSAASDSGNYSIIVSNDYGAVTSSIVSVTIDPAVPVTITNQPASRTIYAGGTARFSVGADGTPPLAYQWKHAGTNLPGATNMTLVVANCAPIHAGSYSVIVSNVASAGVPSSSASLTLATPAAGSYEELIMGYSPVAYWKFQETSGAIAVDSAGSNDGTLVGGVTSTTEAPGIANGFPGFGSANRGYSFDGASGYILGPAGMMNGKTNFTVMGWIHRTAASGNRASFFGQNDKLEFGYRNDTTIECWSGSSLFAPTTLTNEQWGFVVLTYAPGAGARSIYINGRLLSTAGIATAGNNSQSFSIGGGAFNGITAMTDMFPGEMDEVAVLDRALSGPEVCALYNKAIGYAGSVEPTIALIVGSGEAVLTNVDFTTGDGGFTANTPVPTGETDWQYFGTYWWSPGQSTAYGGDNITYLVSPAYAVTRAGALILHLTHSYSFETDWDGGVVEVSINGQPFTRVRQLAFAANSYNATLRADTGTTLAGQRAFSGNSPGHPATLTTSCILGGVQIGDTVSFRFVANYDNNTTGSGTPPGWQITGLQLVEGGSGAAVVACPCGSLQGKMGSLSNSWADLMTGSAVFSTTATNQQYFRVKP